MADIKLNWVDPTTLVDGKAIPAGLFDLVEISVSADGGANFASLDTVEPGVQTYTVTDLPPGTYHFTAVAVDKLGRSSAVASSLATIVAPVPAPLNPVTNFTATVVA